MSKSDVLIKMGYEPQLIAFAMKESTNKSVEEILDLLQFRSKHYKRVIQRKQEKGIQPEFKKKYSIQKGQSKFDPVPKDNEAQPSQENKENLPEKCSTEEHIDNKSKKYAQRLIAELNLPSFDDPNYYISKLLRIFDTIKNDTTPENQILQKHIVAEQGHFPQVLDLKNSVFTVLSKILTMKVKKDIEVETKKLEEAILKAFAMRLMNAKQMDSVIVCYQKFCERLSLPVDEALVEKLEIHSSDTLNYRPPRGSLILHGEEIVSKIKQDEEEVEKNVRDNKKNIENKEEERLPETLMDSDLSFEEINDVDDYVEDEPVDVEMDYCIIMSMEDVEEHGKAR